MVKSWNNFYFSKESNAKLFWDTYFYSKFVLNVKIESICYLMGQKLYSSVVVSVIRIRVNSFQNHIAVDEVTLNSELYYIYHARCNQGHPIQQAYLQNMQKIVESGDVELLKVISRNQSRLMICTDIDTQEVLMVLACINEYEPGFTGYQYFKIV